jgi:hypothetical protein
MYVPGAPPATAYVTTRTARLKLFGSGGGATGAETEFMRLVDDPATVVSVDVVVDTGTGLGTGSGYLPMPTTKEFARLRIRSDGSSVLALGGTPFGSNLGGKCALYGVDSLILKESVGQVELVNSTARPIELRLSVVH